MSRWRQVLSLDQTIELDEPERHQLERVRLLLGILLGLMAIVLGGQWLASDDPAKSQLAAILLIGGVLALSSPTGSLLGQWVGRRMVARQRSSKSG